MVHEKRQHLPHGFHYNAHPMAILSGVVGSLAAFYHDKLDLKDPEQRRLAAIRLIAKMPTWPRPAYRHYMGWPVRYPRNSLEYSERFLHMMFSVPAEPYEIKPVAAKALDLLFILHADHEQNASTSTVRLVGSTGANPYACVPPPALPRCGARPTVAPTRRCSTCSTRSGMSAGSASTSRRPRTRTPFRLMGFGHRVYKNFDPRATIIRKACHEVLGELGVDDPLLEVAMELEEIALEDDYFVERKLYPNVDFYSGIIYKALGIPTSMFTAMFAIGRTAGWVSQWLEQSATPHRIGRPRQVYTGAGEREYVSIDQR
jgi:citrate synthase